MIVGHKQFISNHNASCKESIYWVMAQLKDRDYPKELYSVFKFVIIFAFPSTDFVAVVVFPKERALG